MKNIYIILLTFITLSSCQGPDEFLDVLPTGKAIPTTLEDFDKMLQDHIIIRRVGKNVRFMDPDVFHNSASFATILSNSNSVRAYTWQHQIYDTEQTDEDYQFLYYYIHVMNHILENVDDAPTGLLSESDRNIIKAEALGQRAMEYFLTVNEYAHHYDTSNLDQPGVAMPLSIDLQAQSGKSSVAEVYNQIITDINAALKLLPSNYDPINNYSNFRPGKASLYALLAEVNLYMGDFEAAKTNSNTALAQYNYLYDYNAINLADPTNPWNGYGAPASTEWNFSTLNQEIIWNRYIAEWFTSPFQLYTPELAQLYDKTNDSRWRLFATQTSSTGIDVSPNYIFMYPRSERCNGLSVPRLMLTNAEAKLRTGDGAGAVSTLNTLLEKRVLNFVPLSHINNTSTLQIIKTERRKELAGTSLNIYDQKRYHAYGELVPTFTRTNPNTGEIFTLAPGDDGYVVDIAPTTKNMNPNLD